MSPALALQNMIRVRLVADQAVTALVPPAHISDRTRPARFPSITLGEAREYALGAVKRDASRVVVDVHVWTDTAGSGVSKALAHAVRRAMRDGPWVAAGHTVMDLQFSGSRFMPDPAGEDVTHGVVSFDAYMVEAA